MVEILRADFRYSIMNIVLQNKRLHKTVLVFKKCFKLFNLNYIRIYKNMKLCFKRFNSVDFYIHKNFQLNEYLSVSVPLIGSCRPKKKLLNKS